MDQSAQFIPENGFALAQSVVAQFATQDPFELALLAGVKVTYAHWHPVTWGEFDQRSRSICLNLAAPIPLAKILAHELGHYFGSLKTAQRNRSKEEKMAEEFAEALLNEHRLIKNYPIIPLHLKQDHTTL